MSQSDIQAPREQHPTFFQNLQCSSLSFSSHIFAQAFPLYTSIAWSMLFKMLSLCLIIHSSFLAVTVVEDRSSSPFLVRTNYETDTIVHLLLARG